MNAFSPADSKVVGDISETLTKAIYMLAAAGGIFTLVTASKLIEEQSRVILSFPFLVSTWTVIIIQFLLTRSTLGAVTNRAKWRTLNRIREKSTRSKRRATCRIKIPRKRLFRLADIRKQIMSSKTSTFDLKSVSTLFSQLMLSLLGLLLGNIDKVLDLLP